MHFQIIAEFALPEPWKLAEVEGQSSTDNRMVDAYLVTFGVNAASFGEGVIVVERAVSVRGTYHGRLARIETGSVSLEDWPPDARGSFLAEPNGPGIYFESSRVYFTSDG